MPEATGQTEIEALRRKDAAAFSRLVASHQAIVLGLCQTLGLRGADIDDAAAEVFAAVFRALPGFRGDSAMGTWVYRIALRRIISVRATRSAGESRELPDMEDAAAPPPESRMEAAEREQLIWAAVARLDPAEAAAVELYYRRDWTINQIAEVLNCPPGTVKTHLFRARERLRRVLGPLETD